MKKERTLKVDARLSVSADDDLQLVVPPIGARPDLHATLELVAPAEHGLAYPSDPSLPLKNKQ